MEVVQLVVNSKHRDPRLGPRGLGSKAKSFILGHGICFHVGPHTTVWVSRTMLLP